MSILNLASYLSACNGRQRYTLQARAELEQRRLQRRLEPGQKVRTYLCNFCRGWHVAMVKK